MDSNVQDAEGEVKGNGLQLWPVSAGSSGEGLPYAPINWPNTGDNWSWKVGKRKTGAGFWCDRYLYTPNSFQKFTRKRQRFASLLSVEQYIRKEFPDKDINAFFSSFSWKIPAEPTKDEPVALGILYPEEDMAENSKIDSQPRSIDCKAKNRMCKLRLPSGNYSLPAMDCNICCSEPGFCRDCCCILCSKTIDWTHGGYSFIRCESNVDENYICGHVAHMECALRSYMAGTVGGNIGLDAEYYCRRCDKRTDLIPHVRRVLQTCESLDAREEIEKLLSMGLCILIGSQRTNAKKLLNYMELAMKKLKRGSPLEEILKDDDAPAVSTGTEEAATDQDEVDLQSSGSAFTLGHNSIQKRSQQPTYITSDYRIASVKLEDEVDQVLQSLRKSQETELRIAEERLYAQKNFLVSLYELLESERTALAKQSTSDANSEALLTNVLNRVNQINKESARLREMGEISKGFGRVPKTILTEHFGLDIED